MMASKEGKAPFSHPSFPSEAFTWYKIHGDLASSSTGRPLVVLHGGWVTPSNDSAELICECLTTFTAPVWATWVWYLSDYQPGSASRLTKRQNYLANLKSLSIDYNIPVVLYDQVGCGRSSHFPEKRLDTDFWTPELFVAELDSLLSHLGIANDFDLLGQSWWANHSPFLEDKHMTDLAARRGGMLGATFAVRGHPGLKRLVISNSPASMPLWVESCNEWRKQLPEDVEKALQKHEADKTYDDPECDSSRKKPSLPFSWPLWFWHWYR
jgi:pimeloyl-ACP methyl ester carboxylesterase